MSYHIHDFVFMLLFRKSWCVHGQILLIFCLQKGKKLTYKGIHDFHPTYSLCWHTRKSIMVGLYIFIICFLLWMRIVWKDTIKTFWVLLLCKGLYQMPKIVFPIWYVSVADIIFHRKNAIEEHEMQDWETISTIENR